MTEKEFYQLCVELLQDKDYSWTMSKSLKDSALRIARSRVRELSNGPRVQYDIYEGEF